MNANGATANKATWLPLLGLFTLWLVIQNAIVMAVVTAANPELPVTVIVHLVRVVAHVMTFAGNLAVSIAVQLPDWASFAPWNLLPGGLL